MGRLLGVLCVSQELVLVFVVADVVVLIVVVVVVVVIIAMFIAVVVSIAVAVFIFSALPVLFVKPGSFMWLHPSRPGACPRTGV